MSCGFDVGAVVVAQAAALDDPAAPYLAAWVAQFRRARLLSLDGDPLAAITARDLARQAESAALMATSRVLRMGED